jgi:hypothetical protein
VLCFRAKRLLKRDGNLCAVTFDVQPVAGQADLQSGRSMDA